MTRHRPSVERHDRRDTIREFDRMDLLGRTADVSDSASFASAAMSDESTHAFANSHDDTSFIGQLHGRLRKYIDLMQELRSAGLDNVKGFDLPRLAVAGEQSTGKTSLIEAIIGEDLLPKAEELATRRPLYLKLQNDMSRLTPLLKVGNSEDQLEVVSDVKTLTKKVQALTDEMAGANGAIIDAPIFLHIMSANTPDLTLVDLPGIAKNPLVGSDQTEDIEDVTKSLISKFISSPETVILAVVPANMDAAASDALKLARKHDPAMERTIGVVTKLDLMDKGTSAAKLLQGKYVSFKLGVVGVRNRSQCELNDGMSVQNALRREEQWISTHPEYGKMDKKLFGTKSLSNKLMTVLGTRIQKRLPELKASVLERIGALEKELMSMGDGPPETDREKRREMMKLLENFVHNLNSTINGRVIDHDALESGRSVGAACIRSVFSEFAKEIESEQHHIGDQYSDDVIMKLIQASPGYNLPGFDSFDAFSHLVLKHHKKLKQPCLSTVDTVIEHIRDDVVQSALSHAAGLDTFPDLKEAVKEAAQDIIVLTGTATLRRVEEHLATLEYVHSSDQEYVEVMGLGELMTEAVTELMQKRAGMKDAMQSKKEGRNSLIDRDQDDVKPMRQKMISYDKLVRRSIIDEVPRYVGRWLLMELEKEMLSQLQDQLLSNDGTADLMCEPPDVELKRHGIKQELACLEKAAAVLRKPFGA